MPEIERNRYCWDCEETVMASRWCMINDRIGTLLVLLTCGTFIPIWILLRSYDAATLDWICPECGSVCRRWPWRYP